MTWSHQLIRLACGCEGSGDFDETFPGDEQECKRHGPTTVLRTSRISEQRGSKNYSLDLAPQGGESDVSVLQTQVGDAA